MASGDETLTFGQQVGRRAWFSAWAFFESRTRDAVLFTVIVAIGGGTYYKLYGWPAAWEQIVSILIFTVGPIVALWLLLFLWHLWLAPTALAYEAAREAVQFTSLPDDYVPLSTRPAVNWAPWQRRTKYNLLELASILAKVEPSGSTGSDSEEASYLELLKEETTTGRLRFQRNRRAEDYYQPDVWPTFFDVEKVDAMKWAESKGFDLSHIQ